MPTKAIRHDRPAHDVPAGASEAASVLSPEPLAACRAAFLADLTATFASNPAYTAERGTDTDFAISSNPVHVSWGSGPGRVEYSAVLKAVEADRAVYFWERLQGRSGDAADAAVGHGSASWEWGYGTLRSLIDEVAGRHGFIVKPVLTKPAASW